MTQRYWRFFNRLLLAFSAIDGKSLVNLYFLPVFALADDPVYMAANWH
jgi:hypothetical protein